MRPELTARSQAVRLPLELRFEGKEVIAKRFGNWVLLLPMDAPWEIMKEALDEFEPGFQITRDQPEVQERSGWTE
ncbi:MAG: AbrB/MazE/SpoVT family DNA-binding domain-containing protein [Gemmatimonadales bacterium]|nr:MAG: AbrB/MazE/SpoVT family DNA-binding domain-containing protein [Gemmatimonadales bacterium]